MPKLVLSCGPVECIILQRLSLCDICGNKVTYKVELKIHNCSVHFHKKSVVLFWLAAWHSPLANTINWHLHNCIYRERFQAFFVVICCRGLLPNQVDEHFWIFCVLFSLAINTLKFSLWKLYGFTLAWTQGTVVDRIWGGCCRPVQFYQTPAGPLPPTVSLSLQY